MINHVRPISHAYESERIMMEMVVICEYDCFMFIVYDMLKSLWNDRWTLNYYVVLSLLS